MKKNIYFILFSVSAFAMNSNNTSTAGSPNGSPARVHDDHLVISYQNQLLRIYAAPNQLNAIVSNDKCAIARAHEGDTAVNVSFGAGDPNVYFSFGKDGKFMNAKGLKVDDGNHFMYGASQSIVVGVFSKVAGQPKVAKPFVANEIDKLLALAYSKIHDSSASASPVKTVESSKPLVNDEQANSYIERIKLLETANMRLKYEVEAWKKQCEELQKEQYESHMRSLRKIQESSRSFI